MGGDNLTDEAAALVGELRMAPGLCVGRGNLFMAQATHGSAPDIAGAGLANLYSMMEATRMLTIPEAAEASRLMTKGIERALSRPPPRGPQTSPRPGARTTLVQAILDGIGGDDGSDPSPDHAGTNGVAFRFTVGIGSAPPR